MAVDKESNAVKNLLKETANGSLNGKASPQDVVKNLDQMLARMRGLKRKLTVVAEEENRLYRQMSARVGHLRELTDLNTVDDVKYEAWSRQRLDRLLVDYMLRHGYDASAIALAEERGIRDLVDIDTFVVMVKISKSLEGGSVQEALSWCNENKKELRKMQVCQAAGSPCLTSHRRLSPPCVQSNLEFMLRCQQYIEMMRTGSQSKTLEAINHAKKYITPYNDTYPVEVSNMAGLLAYRPDTELEPYRSLYSASRWKKLAETFVEAHLKLLNLPMSPLLHIALSSGLSALKTPACHSTQARAQDQDQTPSEYQTAAEGSTARKKPSSSSSSSSSSPTPPHHGTASLTTRVCPICSTELNALARNVRYAHHSKSHLLEHDLMLLPNGRVYGKARLDEYAVKSGLPAGQVKDLVTGEVYSTDELRKVFVT